MSVAEKILTMKDDTAVLPSSHAVSRFGPVAVHSARTAIAAVASILAARLVRLPEIYWAPITSIVITQSSLGAALSVSGERFVGTVLGTAIGAIAASYFGPNVFVFGAGVFILGLLSSAAHSNRNAYRFAGVTLAIVQLVPWSGTPWHFALHRFTEVCIGIGVALIFSVVWPEQEEVPSKT
jgi:uncharacterized membrane protein YgaE (UPF0421/DUF939 family)